MRRSALLAATVVLAGAAPAPALGDDTAAVQRTLATQMRLAGPYSGAYVQDLDSGAQLFADAPDRARVPASVTKLFTTSTALLRYGPAGTIDTLALTLGAVDARGVLQGDLYLVGHGDPTFGHASASVLAGALAATGVRRIAGAVRADESFFDARRSARFAGYDFDLFGVLSATAFDRGLDRGRPQLAAATFAARRFAAALRAAGVRSTEPSAAGVAPAGAREIARLTSPTLRSLVRLTNVPSDNFYAEMLLKGMGATFGTSGSTSAGTGVVRASLRRAGITPPTRMVDGSGLSPTNRTTPRQVVELLARMESEPRLGRSLRSSLATAGRTGTLRRRMRGTSAAGRCRAKTGTLRSVSALAGYCRTRSGRDVAFSFLMNGVSIDGAHRLQDRMTVALARLDGAAADR